MRPYTEHEGEGSGWRVRLVVMNGKPMLFSHWDDGPWFPISKADATDRVMAARVEVDAAVAGGGEVAMKAQLIDVGGSHPHERIAWHCPGCKCHHGVPVPPHAGAWSWNSSLNEPTLNPSVVIQLNGSVCHSFVRDGKIMFLGDCTHELAGQTVEMRAVEMEEFE